MVVAVALRPVRPVQLAPPVSWYAPHPLWRAIPRDEMSARRGVPVILRFATDTFMEDLIALLESGEPEQLTDFVAQPETWRDKPALIGWDEDGHDRVGTLKLFQAAHQRFYLVAGALACRIPGVPDKILDSSQKESVFFVIRQLDEDGLEYAWSAEGWTLLQDPEHTLLESEERQPLFPFSFQQEGSTRRLLAGLIPVASKEAAPSVTEATIGEVSASDDPRPGLFEQEVTAAVWSVMKWYETHIEGSGASVSELRGVEHGLAYAFLDMMTALKDNVTSLYDDIVGTGIRSNTSVYGDASSLAQLIRNAGDTEEVLKTIDADDTRDYLLNTMGADGDVSDAPGMEGVWYDNETPYLQAWVDLSHQNYGDMALQTAYSAALANTTYEPQPSQYPSLPKSDPMGNKFHIIRMVYEQPQCKRITLSKPTREFLLAPFFDPDAPVRPIRIAMPVDTTVEGLKKFDKGVSVIISNQLKAQMNRVSGMKDLIDGNVNPEGTIDLGLICSLSIPIITICALILLMIIVSLLNIIFFWMPLFKICLPLPVPRPPSGG
jgi:hypothetical protein